MIMARALCEDLWYAKRDGITRGPFPGEYITRYILLGRIRLNDELSRTGRSWRPVADFPELFPEELHEPTGWDDYRKLVVARIRYDERISERRSHRESPLPNDDRRKQPERRRVGENIEILEYHLLDRIRYMQINSGYGVRSSLRVYILAALLATLVAVYLGVSVR